MSEKYAVIGGARMLGYEIVRQLLDRGHNVRVLDLEVDLACSESTTYPRNWSPVYFMFQRNLVQQPTFAHVDAAPR